MKKIQILGTGCAKCQKLAAVADEAARALGVPYDLQKVTDLKQMEQCMKATYDLGRQVVQIAAKKFEYPKDIPRRSIGYGTHTK